MFQNSYAFKNTNEQLFLKSLMSCDSRNLIYLVKCPTYKKGYIGETGIAESRFRDRECINNKFANLST